MWKKIMVAGAAGAAALGGGAAALAASGDNTASSAAPATASTTTATTATAKPHPKAAAARLALRRVEHAEWVSRDGSADVTHDAIRGTVTAVSTSSISVKATDGISMTFTIGSDTQVVLRTSGKGSATKGAITSVKTGETVLVSGVKTGSALTAEHVVDAGTK